MKTLWKLFVMAGPLVFLTVVFWLIRATEGLRELLYCALFVVSGCWAFVGWLAICDWWEARQEKPNIDK